jgi:hypothetical protein
LDQPPTERPARRQHRTGAAAADDQKIGIVHDDAGAG